MRNGVLPGKRLRITSYNVCYTKLLRIVRQGVRIVMHPAIEDRGDSVALTCLDTADRAIALTRQGIVRLLALRLEPQLRYVRRALAADT